MSVRRRAKRVQQPPQVAKNEKRKPDLIPAAIILTLLVAGAAYIASRIHSSHAAGSASALQGSADNSANSGLAIGTFQPTIENRKSSPEAPKGMVWIPGGEFSMGANDPPDQDEVGMKATLDARPIHRVYVDGFYMDKTDVTNTQFAEFVKATGYLTIAERTPSRGFSRCTT